MHRSMDYADAAESLRRIRGWFEEYNIDGDYSDLEALLDEAAPGQPLSPEAAAEFESAEDWYGSIAARRRRA